MNRVSKSSLNYLSQTYHMVGLQETRFESFENFKRVKHLWEETLRFNTSFWSQDHMTGYTGRAGVGLLLTPTCPIKDIQDVTLRHASSPALTDRYLLLRGTLDSTTTYIHVVYAPVKPNKRPSFFNLLPRNFDEDEDGTAFHIVMGDFNTVLDSRMDQANQTDRNRTQGQTELLDWMQAIDVADALRLQHPTLVENSDPNARARIDYVLMSPRLFRSAMQNILHDFRRKAELGDHNGIDFRLGSTTFRPATRPPWRCPEWVIQLPGAQKHLRESLEELANRLHAPTDERYNPGCLLDEHKRRDAIFLCELFQSRKNARQREIEELHLEINRLRHLEATNPSADQANQLSEKKAQLDVKLQERKHYASQKKFAADLKDAEQGSKFFFRPPQILHNTPIPVNSPEKLDTMCDEFNHFWFGVYRSPSKEFSHPKPKWNRLQMAEILQHTTAHLTPEQAAYMDSPLTANNFYWAIKHTTAGKAPGPDGLPLAYYLTDLTLWYCILEVVYAAQLERGRMSKFQRRGQVCLLYKKGNRKEPGNYRPITLLNVNAKFGPKILAFRLGKLLDSLLGSDQYGFVPGRDIHHAHVRFQALMKLYEDEMDCMAGAVLLDFAKAFDSVVWNALDMILMHFGFGSPLAPFEIGRGVRQGDPLSPGLFVLFVEPLLNLIRARMKDAVTGLHAQVAASHL